MGFSLILPIVISFVLTQGLEVLFALIYGIRSKKDLGLLMLVNVITNPPVVLIYYLATGYTGVNPWAAAIILELAVVAAEAYYFRRYGKGYLRPVTFAVLVNAFSYGIGLCLTLFPQTAAADLIWTPSDDFYINYSRECEQEGRSYTANGADGSVTMKENPNSGKTVSTLENGTEYYVSFTYLDKKNRKWGVIQLEDRSTGWVRMRDMLLVYDNIAFLEQYAAEFKDYAGEFDDYAMGEDPVLVWSYPGSGVINGTITKDINSITENNSITQTYTDLNGRLWGQVPYHFGYRGWICISDPADKDLPAVEQKIERTSEPETEEDTEDEEEKGIFSGEGKEVILLQALIVGLAAITAGLIRRFWKKEK